MNEFSCCLSNTVIERLTHTSAIASDTAIDQTHVLTEKNLNSRIADVLVLFTNLSIEVSSTEGRFTVYENPERVQSVREAMLTRSMKALRRVKAGEVLKEVLVCEIRSERKLAGTLTTHAKALNNADNSPLTLSKPSNENETFGFHSVKSVNALIPGPKPKAGEGRRDAYDRWFFNGCDQNNKDCFFAAALGFYPGGMLKDASVSVVCKGVQHVRTKLRGKCENEKRLTSNGNQLRQKCGPRTHMIVKARCLCYDPKRLPQELPRAERGRSRGATWRLRSFALCPLLPWPGPPAYSSRAVRQPALARARIAIK